MTGAYNSSTKKIAFRFVQENIDYRKRCLYLQEIISLGRTDNIWLSALTAFFDTPLTSCPTIFFSNN